MASCYLVSGSTASASVFNLDLYVLYKKKHLFDGIGSNTKDQNHTNGLDEVDLGSCEVVHSSDK